MSESSAEHPPFEIAGRIVQPNSSLFFDLEVARLPTETGLAVPVCVLHGHKPGPVMWVNAAIHGDEINGVEIIRRLIKRIVPSELRGTLVAVPIVNVFGFINQDRYLPDRRDLNRSFPGSPRGSLAAQIAHLFLTKIVSVCEVGIDLHTASNHRNNLPQIRSDFNDPRTRELADAFAPPIIIKSNLADGSLREAASLMGKRVMLYEGGEPSRFNQHAIVMGEKGVLRVMQKLDMWDAPRSVMEVGAPSLYSESSSWVRASRSGILRSFVDVGDIVFEDEDICAISDVFDRNREVIKAPHTGVVVGQTKLPLLNEGDAIAHIARAEIPEGMVRQQKQRKTIFLER